MVVRTGQAGAACVVPEDMDGANCVDLLIVRRSPRLDPHFLEFVINSDWTIRHIEKHSVGSIQSHFNVESLKQLPVPVPPLVVQAQTSAKLRRIVADLDTAHAEARLADQASGGASAGADYSCGNRRVGRSSGSRLTPVLLGHFCRPDIGFIDIQC